MSDFPRDHRGLMVVQTIFNDHQSKLIKEEEEEEEEEMKIEERAFWVRRDAEEYVAEVHKQTGTTMIIHVSKIGAFYRVKEKKRNWEKERV